MLDRSLGLCGARNEEGMMPGRRLKQVAAVVVILGLAGPVFEQIGRYRDRSRFKQIGRSVNIGGRTLNLFHAWAREARPLSLIPTATNPGTVGSPFKAQSRSILALAGMIARVMAGANWGHRPGPFNPLPRTFAHCCGKQAFRLQSC